MSDRIPATFRHMHFFGGSTPILFITRRRKEYGANSISDTAGDKKPDRR
ncbi:MAG: hypothetical protein ACLRXA_22970 [Clostridium sp.]